MNTIIKQRQLLVQTMRDLEPYQWALPSLCEGWTVKEVIAHLIIRERKPWTGLGLVNPKYYHWHDVPLRKLGNERSQHQILKLLANGPPLLMRMLGDIQVCEDWIHWQDIVRGICAYDPNAHSLDKDNGSTHEDIQQVLINKFPMYAKNGLATITSNARILVTDGREQSWMWLTDAQGSKPMLASDGLANPDVTVTGEIGELLMWFTGRKDAAAVEITGNPDFIALLNQGSFTI